MKAHTGSTVIALLSLNLALDRGGWLTPRSGRFTPRKVTRYPMHGRHTQATIPPTQTAGHVISCRRIFTIIEINYRGEIRYSETGRLQEDSGSFHGKDFLCYIFAGTTDFLLPFSALPFQTVLYFR